MKPPTPRAAQLGRRLANRTLPSLLRYKFLHEYGYGTTARSWSPPSSTTSVKSYAPYFTRPDDLEPGEALTVLVPADQSVALAFDGVAGGELARQVPLCAPGQSDRRAFGVRFLCPRRPPPSTPLVAW